MASMLIPLLISGHNMTTNLTIKMMIICLCLSILGCGPDIDLPIKNIHIYFQHDQEHITAIATTFSLSCPTVYAGGGAFIQNNIVVSGNSGSIQIIQNTACTLTITNFNDGTSSYSPTSTSLVISISASRVITSSGSIANPPPYSNGSANLYLYLASSTSSSLRFVYTYDPSVQPVTYIPLGLHN